MRILCGLMAAISLLFLTGCTPAVPITPVQDIPSDAHSSLSEVPLMATVETREDAEALAQQYEIILVSFDYGIATFSTEEDPCAVIERGIRNGWQELSLNYVTQMP